MPIRAILYDLDGVLVDACDWHYESLNRALFDVCGESIDRDEHIKTFNGIPTLKKLEILEQQGRVKSTDFAKISKLKQDYTIEVIKQRASMNTQLMNLHMWTSYLGIVSACVTNSITETARLMLERTGQLFFMKLLITNEIVKTPKPSPEGYFKAIELLGFKPEECVIVEDSPKGLEAARQTGCIVVQVKDSTEVRQKVIEVLEKDLGNFIYE